MENFLDFGVAVNDLNDLDTVVVGVVVVVDKVKGDHRRKTLGCGEVCSCCCCTEAVAVGDVVAWCGSVACGGCSGCSQDILDHC
jgi:hypothetical protein